MKEEIELRSNEVQEILSRPPKWIVRWGITIILSVVIVLVIGSWFFQYPDIISSKIVLTTQNPPAPVFAKASGKIQNLFVIDQQQVKKDEVLAVIENPANYNDIQMVDGQLKLFNPNSPLQNEQIKNFSRKLNLGSIQSFYADFLKNLDDYYKFVSLDYYQKKINLQKKEILQYKKYTGNLKVQNGLQ